MLKKKKKMTMKRVDQEEKSENTSDHTEDQEIQKKVAIEVESVNKAAMVKPPEEMEEVSYIDYMESNKSILATNISEVDNIKNKVKDFVGKKKEDVETLLESLKSEKVISEFRIIPIGQVYSSEFKDDRVQVLIDNEQVIVDVIVG